MKRGFNLKSTSRGLYNKGEIAENLLENLEDADKIITMHLILGITFYTALQYLIP